MSTESGTETKWKKVALAILSLAITLSFLGLIVWITWRAFAFLSSQVAATVIVGIITASASVFAVLKNKQAEHRRDIENELRKQKAPIYEEFSSFLFKVLMAAKTDNAVSQEEMLEFVVNFNRRLIVWGADSVIKEWSIFKTLHEVSNSPPAMTLIAIEKILMQSVLIWDIRIKVSGKVTCLPYSSMIFTYT